MLLRVQSLVVDGRGLSITGNEDGFFLGGSLFDRVTPEMRIYKEEIFGSGVVRGPGEQPGGGDAIDQRP